jgi:fumarate hydratase subunit beta
VVRNGGVYLAALGGAGALMAESVKSLQIICWEDLGCEAVRKLEVENFPLTVILDPHGGDLYESGPAAYLNR